MNQIAGLLLVLIVGVPTFFFLRKFLIIIGFLSTPYVQNRARYRRTLAHSLEQRAQTIHHEHELHEHHADVPTSLDPLDPNEDDF